MVRGECVWVDGVPRSSRQLEREAYRAWSVTVRGLLRRWRVVLVFTWRVHPFPRYYLLAYDTYREGSQSTRG